MCVYVCVCVCNFVLQIVRLHFLTHTFGNSSECNNKIIDVYDGPYDTAPLLYSYCDGIWPGDVISSGSTVFVSYAPRDPRAQTMFRITYTATDPIQGAINNYDNQCYI